MKKFMYAAIAALAITSCSQNEEFEAPGQKAEIQFGGVVGKATRAEIIETNNFGEFFVNAYYTDGDMAAGSALGTPFMKELSVKKVDEWGYTGTFYWPAEGKVQFFASAPKQTLNAPVTGYPAFDYTIKAQSTQEDLLAANMIDQVKTKDAIKFGFKHILSQVNFSIKGDTKGFTYEVTNLTISGVNDKATFTFDGTDNVGSWGVLAKSESTLSYSYGGNVELITATDNIDKVVDFDAEKKASLFILMPQTLDANAKLSITYTATPTGADQKATFSGTKEVTLTGTWTLGKKTRYTLTLTSDAEPVTFSAPVVTPWNTEETDIPTPVTPVIPEP